MSTIFSFDILEEEEKTRRQGTSNKKMIKKNFKELDLLIARQLAVPIIQLCLVICHSILKALFLGHLTEILTH